MVVRKKKMPRTAMKARRRTVIRLSPTRRTSRLRGIRNAFAAEARAIGAVGEGEGVFLCLFRGRSKEAWNAGRS